MLDEQQILLEVMPTQKFTERTERRYYSNEMQKMEVVSAGYVPIDPNSSFGYAYRTVRILD